SPPPPSSRASACSPPPPSPPASSAGNRESHENRPRVAHPADVRLAGPVRATRGARSCDSRGPFVRLAGPVRATRGARSCDSRGPFVRATHVSAYRDLGMLVGTVRFVPVEPVLFLLVYEVK